MTTLDYRLHDLLTLRLTHGGGPLLGHLLSRYAHYQVPASSAEAELSVELGSFAAAGPGCFRLDGFYRAGPDYLECAHSYKLARWRVAVEGWGAPRTRLRIDPNPAARMVIPGETVPSLVRWKLLRKGAVLVHGSAVEKDGRAIVFAGRSGAGKTITAARFVQAGYRFLSDDSCILAPGRVLSLIQPFTVRFTYDAGGLFGNPFTASQKAAILAKRGLALATAGRINLLTSLPPAQVMGASLGSEGRLHRFVILQGGDAFKVEGLSLDRAVEQTLLNIGFESRELTDYLDAMTHAFPGGPWSRFRADQQAALRACLAGVPLLRITVPGRYTEEIFGGIRAAVEGA